VTPPWWAAFPPAEARIRCGAGEHVLRWAGGRLNAVDHDDTEGELVLAALGGDQAECVALLEAWGAHADDLDVLALGPRSPADELAVTPELVDELRTAFGPPARSVPMRPGPSPGPPGGGPGGPGAAAGPPGAALPGRGPRAYASPGPGSLRGGPRPGARPWRGRPARRLSPEQERARARRAELLSLFALGGDFQLRLSAQVASAWSEGGLASTERARAGPALTAALTGRLAPAAGPWLGVDPDAVRATLHQGPGWGRVEGDGPGLRAALPLSWLARVWAPGFPVVDGHLVVDVLEVSWPQVRVLGLPAPGAEPAVLTIRLDGEHWSRAGGAG
jgi:hypothetical protein